MQDRMSHRHKLESPSRQVATDSPTCHRIDWRTRAMIASFGYAFAGIWYLLRTQRNAQIHVLAGSCAISLGLILGLERWEWLALVLIITLVIAAEGVNTAIEATVDLATSIRHPLAKVAKDVAAGTVLICAIGAVIVGCIVFLPHLLTMFNGES